MKPNVKLTNPVTCRIVAEITRDPEHIGTCPIMMKREKWDLIKGFVKIKKEQRTVSQEWIKEAFKDIFENMK